MIKKVSFVILFMQLSFSIFALNGIADIEIKIPSQSETIGSMMKYLEKNYGILFSYIEKDIPMEHPVVIKSPKLTLNKLLSEMFAGTDIQFSITAKQVVLKKALKSNTKYKISGMVLDSSSHESLAGTNIYIKGENSGTVGNSDGSYAINLYPGEYTLVYKFIGYKNEERKINVAGDLSIDVIMRSSINQIGEVKVTKQRDFWGNMDRGRNINTLDAKKIELLNTNNATNILQASMPGVWSANTSGAPGDHQKVIIRGLNTLFGCTDPLYIIDGVAVPIVDQHSLGIADLNIHDIESITVLKDASSTSLYGYQGGNGVVIIETKRYNGKPHISFSTKLGFQQVPKKLDLMNTKDFLSALDTAKANNISSIRRYYPTYSTDLQSRNWQNVVFQTGIIHEYQLSGTTSLNGYNFFISGNYYTHGGIISNSGYNRYSLNANVSKNINKKLVVELNFRSSLQNNTNNIDSYYGNNILLEGINKSPLLGNTPDTLYLNPPVTPKDPKNNPPSVANRIFFNYPLLNRKESVDSIIHNTQNKLNINANTLNLALKYYMLDNLFLNASSSLTYRKHNYISSVRTSSDNIIRAGTFNAETDPEKNYMNSSENYLLFNQQLNLNYNKILGNHELTVVAGYRNYADNAYWKLDSLVINGNSNDIYLKNSLAINGNNGSVSRFIQSFAAHFNYNYNKKYFISVIANYESLTVDNFNIGGNFFPSVALTWDISKEIGLKNLNWFDQFNIYVNWGKTGNYPLNGLSHDFYTNYNYNYYDTVINGKAVSQLANHFLRQEIISEYNVGTDIHLFNNKVRITADYYTKNSSNLIIMRNIPYYYGGGRMYINIGKLKNYGKEFSFEADIINSQNFTWTSSFAISSNHQRVLDIGSGQNQLTYWNSDILIPEFEVKTNEEVGVIKGFKFIGFWNDSDDAIQSRIGLKYPYVNLNGNKYAKAKNVQDYNLKDSDKFVLGKTLPDYTWHFINTFAYKNFSVYMVWYAVMGISKYNATKAATYMAGTNRGVLPYLKNNSFTLRDSSFYQSSYFVEDASFIRLKQVTFSYKFPKKIYKVADLTLSVSFENLLTFTKYTGYDPEASIYTDNTFSNFAIDRGAYPVPRSVFFTLNLDF